MVDHLTNELTPGWLKRQVDSSTRDTAAVGGSWEPGSIIAHCHKQQVEIANLREVLQEIIICAWSDTFKNADAKLDAIDKRAEQALRSCEYRDNDEK